MFFLTVICLVRCSSNKQNHCSIPISACLFGLVFSRHRHRSRGKWSCIWLSFTDGTSARGRVMIDDHRPFDQKRKKNFRFQFLRVIPSLVLPLQSHKERKEERGTSTGGVPSLVSEWRSHSVPLDWSEHTGCLSFCYDFSISFACSLAAWSRFMSWVRVMVSSFHALWWAC